MATKIKVGDRVRLTGKFLRNTGQHTGPEGQSVWTVTALDGPGGAWAVTDQPLADVSMFTPDELRADPSLRFRRINVGNLERVRR